MTQQVLVFLTQSKSVVMLNLPLITSCSPLRLRSPSEVMQLVHRHYDTYVHHQSGLAVADSMDDR